MPKQAACQPIRLHEPYDRSPTAKKIKAAIESHLEAVEYLIAVLDRFDADPDLEEDGCHDEPSLGSSESRDGGTCWAHGGQGIGFDCEIDAGDCGELDHEEEANRQPPMLDGLKLPERDESVRRPQEYLGSASPLKFRGPVNSPPRSPHKSAVRTTLKTILDPPGPRV